MKITNISPTNYGDDEEPINVVECTVEGSIYSGIEYLGKGEGNEDIYETYTLNLIFPLECELCANTHTVKVSIPIEGEGSNQIVSYCSNTDPYESSNIEEVRKKYLFTLGYGSRTDEVTDIDLIDKCDQLLVEIAHEINEDKRLNKDVF